MVGIDKLKEYLGGFNANYVIIGGTARNLLLEEAGLQGRVTKDIDMIVVCEAINPEYLRQFWAFIKAGGYTPERVDAEDGARWSYYRFKDRTDPAFPEYIELFSRLPDGIQVRKRSVEEIQPKPGAGGIVQISGYELSRSELSLGL